MCVSEVLWVLCLGWEKRGAAANRPVKEYLCGVQDSLTPRNSGRATEELHIIAHCVCVCVCLEYAEGVSLGLF